MKQSNLRESNDKIAPPAQTHPIPPRFYLPVMRKTIRRYPWHLEEPFISLTTKNHRPQRLRLMLSDNPPLVALGSSVALPDQPGVPKTITCLLHPFTSIVSFRSKLPPATGQVFILKIFVLRGRMGGVFFDGEFQRTVGLGKSSASGAKVTQLAGSHVDLSISAFSGRFRSW